MEKPKILHQYKRTIDIENVKTYGLSEGTARHQFGSMCGTGCVFDKENEREEHCIDCSHQIAERDLDVLAKYKTNITTAAEEKCFPAALLAAFISRQTMAGAEIETEGRDYDAGPPESIGAPGTGGWLYCHNSHYMCYGLMHMPESEFILYSSSLLIFKLKV